MSSCKSEIARLVAGGGAKLLGNGLGDLLGQRRRGESIAFATAITLAALTSLPRRLPGPALYAAKK